MTAGNELRQRALDRRTSLHSMDSDDSVPDVDMKKDKAVRSSYGKTPDGKGKGTQGTTAHRLTLLSSSSLPCTCNA